MGRATALALAREGASLILFGRRREPLDACAQEIEAEGARALVFPLDVADDRAVDAAVAAAVERFGRIDILVNNAGTNITRRALREVSVADWHRVLATNLTGVFICTRAVLPAMRQQRAGLIINVLSGAALNASAIPGAAYSASKRGAVAISQIINAEEAENGIRATTIYPGDTVTPILDSRPTPPSAEAKALMLQPEDIAATVLYVATLPDRAWVVDLNIRPWKKRR